MYPKIVIALLFVMCAALGATAVSALTECERQEGFVSLFDGETLSGWTVMGDQSWSVQSGIIVCSGQGGGWLRSNNQYRNFVLRMDYRIVQGGNSGLFLRATEDGNPAFTGMEIQILGDHGQPPSKHSNASVYDAIAPTVNLSRPPSDWNSYEIVMVEGGLSVGLNGRVVLVADLFGKDLNAGLSDELKFPNRAPAGFIGMQNHGNKVEFRNIRIKELKAAEAPANP